MISSTVRRRVKKVVLWVEILFILILGAGVGVIAGAFYQISKVLPPESYLKNYKTPAGTTILSADGVLLGRLAAENREPVSLARIPQVMQHAMIDIEDARFYRHSGLDMRGLIRALWVNVRGGDLTGQGASTNPQQLARNIYLTRSKTVSRKVKETLLAVQIERNWSKQQILEMYFNQVYFGSGAYGIQSAAKTYFAKDVRDLTLAEAATLAGLPQRPSELSPYVAKERDGDFDVTIDRRNQVLQRMADMGHITPDEARQAMRQPLKLAHEKPPQLGGYYRAKHFVDYVVTHLREVYGDDMLFKGGLKVLTTLNWKAQREAERAVREGVRRKGPVYRMSEGALIALEPATGFIRAMVGGVQEPWERYQFNCAAHAHRSPGSAFKMFVYAAALERGMTPYRSVSTYVRPIKDGNKWWQPKNHGRVGGAMSLVTAFAHSVNTAAVNLNLQVGPANVVEMGHRLGIESKLLPNPALALGTSEVTVLEMAAAYSVLANKGNRADPQAILRITNQDGAVIESNQPRVVREVLTEEVVRGMNVLTRAVVTGGTGRSASRVPNAHGKTGTGEEHRDVWFVGYTPELSTAIWAGNRDNSKMRGIYGGDICAPIWADFMSRALPIVQKRAAEKPAKGRKGDRPAPDPVTSPPADEEDPQPVPVVGGANAANLIRVKVCTESRVLATRFCPSTETQDFLSGDYPKARCATHQGVKENGRARPRVERTLAGVRTVGPTGEGAQRRRGRRRRAEPRPDPTIDELLGGDPDPGDGRRRRRTTPPPPGDGGGTDDGAG